MNISISTNMGKGPDIVAIESNETFHRYVRKLQDWSIHTVPSVRTGLEKGRSIIHACAEVLE